MGTLLKELVERFGGQLVGDANITLTGIAPLDLAEAGNITFLSNPRLRSQATQTCAAALILSTADNALIGSSYRGARIVAANPYAYFARVAQFFAEKENVPATVGIHPTAVIHSNATVARNASIGPHVVIEAGAQIDEKAVIEAGCFIGRDTRIGAATHLHARVTFYSGCCIGQRGIIHSGAVIGADGFGFANENGMYVKIPQTGGVVIGDDVEIGANTTIDRGTFNDTVIEDGVKLDNQVHIAHNVQVGAHTAMAGCVGVAGSAKIGKFCAFGGAAMILGHLDIADHVQISAGSLVSRSIRETGQYTGFYPLAKNTEWEKSAAIVRNLSAMREKLRELEKAVKSLSEEESGKTLQPALAH